VEQGSTCRYREEHGHLYVRKNCNKDIPKCVVHKKVARGYLEVAQMRHVQVHSL